MHRAVRDGRQRARVDARNGAVVEVGLQSGLFESGRLAAGTGRHDFIIQRTSANPCQSFAECSASRRSKQLWQKLSSIVQPAVHSPGTSRPHHSQDRNCRARARNARPRNLPRVGSSNKRESRVDLQTAPGRGSPIRAGSPKPLQSGNAISTQSSRTRTNAPAAPPTPTQPSGADVASG